MTEPIQMRIHKLKKLSVEFERDMDAQPDRPSLEMKLIQNARNLSLTMEESAELCVAMRFLTIQESVFQILLDTAQSAESQARSLHIIEAANLLANSEKQISEIYEAKKSLI